MDDRSSLPVFRLLGVPYMSALLPLDFHHLGATARLLGSYLLYNAGKRFTRDHLADLIWPSASADRARAALNTALWRIRNAIGPHAEIGATRTEIFAAADAADRVDARRFRDGAEAVLAAPDEAEADRLGAVADLYAGPLLEGEAADWVRIEREALHELQIRLLGLLAQKFSERGLLEEASFVGRRILALDPYHEQVHHDLILVYALLGRRNLALRQFDQLRGLLADDLGLAPSREVRSLIELVRSDEDRAALLRLRSHCFAHC